MIPAFRFDKAELAALADRYGPEFRENAPFPFVVIPNLLPIEIARELAREFPAPTNPGWRLTGPGDASHTGDPQVEKLGASSEQFFPPLTRHIMHEFNSGTFVGFIEALTGWPGLLPDPSFYGCGLHSTGRGGRLMVHADASRHPNPKLHQILNMIYYATPDWEDAWGGQLEMWDREATQCIKKVSPTFNSAVIFFTGSRSYHGHPHPLETPPGVRRNSLAAYYYTTDREADSDYAGYKNYVEWVRTTDLDRKISPYHMVKAGVRRYLPASLVNGLAKTVRAIRK
jgi:2OG-Fe(II) oxygenase superfamily